MIFLKANAASLLASICDLLITMMVFEWFGWGATASGVAGTVCGGVINFFTGRLWVFYAGRGKLGNQALRYLLVWSGYLMLSAWGIFLLSGKPGLHYMVSKIIVAVALAVTYNYPLQRKFVFSNN